MFKFKLFDRKIFIYFLIFFVLLFCVVFFVIKSNFYVEDNSRKKTIVFWTMQLGTFDNYVNNVISNFEKEFPEYKVKWVDIPYSEAEKRTLASVLTDNPPDLVNLTPDFSLLLAKRNALYFINKDDIEQYLPSIMETLNYDGNYFGIPFYSTSAVTLYNTKLVSKEIKTYDDLFSFDKLSNVYLTMINFSENDTFLKILNKYGIDSPEKIKNNESVYLYSNFKHLYDSGMLPKESVTQTHRDALEKYMSGQLAYIVTGANFLNMIKENAPLVYKNTKILPQLVGTTGKYDYSLMNFVIPKRAKNIDGAIKFAKYFTNETNQLEFSHLTTVLPVNKYALNSQYFLMQSKDNIIQQARYISAFQLKNVQPAIPNVKNKKELNDLSANYIQQILINNADIKSTLNDFSSDWEKL